MDTQVVFIGRNSRRGGSSSTESHSENATIPNYEGAKQGLKFNAGHNTQKGGIGLDMKKLEEESTDFHHKEITHDLRLAIQQARTKKGITQKQLAQRINEKPSVVNDYENGRVVPSPQVLNKIEKVLGRVRPPKGKKK